MVPSDDDARYLRDELGVPGERLTRVDSGVGDEFFEIEHRGTAGEGPRILFAGAWIDKKGAPDLVDAWRLVAAAHPTASLSVTCTVTDERNRPERLRRKRGARERAPAAERRRTSIGPRDP